VIRPARNSPRARRRSAPCPMTAPTGGSTLVSRPAWLSRSGRAPSPPPH